MFRLLYIIVYLLFSVQLRLCYSSRFCFMEFALRLLGGSIVLVLTRFIPPWTNSPLYGNIKNMFTAKEANPCPN